MDSIIKMHDVDSIIKMRDDILDSLSVSVKISWKEVLNIVIQDLLKKYKYVLTTLNTAQQESFKTVLLYYVTEDELRQMLMTDSRKHTNEQGSPDHADGVMEHIRG